MRVSLSLLYIASVCVPHGSLAVESNYVTRGGEVKKEGALSSLGLGAGAATRASGEKGAETTSEDDWGLESNADVRGEGREYENESEYEVEPESSHPEQQTDTRMGTGIPVEVEIDSDGSSMSEDAMHMRVRLNAENTARRQDLAVTRAAARLAAEAQAKAHPATFHTKVPYTHTLMPCTHIYSTMRRPCVRCTPLRTPSVTPSPSSSPGHPLRLRWREQKAHPLTKSR